MSEELTNGHAFHTFKRAPTLQAEALKEGGDHRRTDPRVHGEDPSLVRSPARQMETGVAGVFAAGDIRAGSMKRVASAVGEGATAIAQVHRHLPPD